MQKIYRSLAIALGCAAVAILAGCSGGEMGLPPPISVATAPGSATVPAGTTARFSATVAEDANNRGVTWTVTCSAAACGSVSPTTTPSGTATTYTAPSSPPASDLTVTVTATSAADKSKSGSIIVTVPAVAVSVTPDPATVPAATNQQFTATVINTSNTTVSWTLTQGGAACSPDCGTLSSATSNPVTYSAPATPPATDLTLTLMATSAADKTKSYSATIIFPAISVSVSGPTTVAEDTSQQFAATVSNDPANKGGTWTLTQGGAACSPGCGTLSGQTSTSVTYNALGAGRCAGESDGDCHGDFGGRHNEVRRPRRYTHKS